MGRPVASVVAMGQVSYRLPVRKSMSPPAEGTVLVALNNPFSTRSADDSAPLADGSSIVARRVSVQKTLLDEPFPKALW